MQSALKPAPAEREDAVAVRQEVGYANPVLPAESENEEEDEKDFVDWMELIETLMALRALRKRETVASGGQR